MALITLDSPEPESPVDDYVTEPPPIVDGTTMDYFILKQEVELDVNFRDRCIAGSTDIFLVTFNDKVEEIVLDAAQFDIKTDEITITEMREVNGELIEGYKRHAHAEYDDPYDKLSHPKGRQWKTEHHDLRRMRARPVFHSRKVDVPAQKREFEGCTPAYGSLRVKLRGGTDQERPRLILRKSTFGSETVSEKTHRQLKITIPFVNKNPRDGLHFVGVDPMDSRYTHMYTRQSIQPGTASCIFPCMDDHGCRCDWKITIRFPRTMGDALHQALASQRDSANKDRSLALVEEDKLREMMAVCSGFLMEEGVDPNDHQKKFMVFEPEKKVSAQKLGFAIGPFDHIDLSSEFRTEEDEVKLGISALKLHAYCLPRRGDWVRHTCAALTMAADYFTYSFARYPFDNFKLVFLEDMEEDTAIMQSLAFASNRMLFPEDIQEPEMEVTRQLVYTLTSQWIGINIIPNTRNDLWLTIGIAHYITDLFMKKIGGNNEYRFRVKAMSDRLVQLDIDRPSVHDLGPLMHIDPYEAEFMALKTPVVFFILDKRLTKVSGGHGLTRILQKMLTKAQIEGGDKATILDTEKFRGICERASKYLLEDFWAQWVYGAGCPKFDVKARFNKKRLCVELILDQTQAADYKDPTLETDNFLRNMRERRARVPTSEPQRIFTGPMTVRIHEADGTPYEHILEVRDEPNRLKKFEIPYNTKYKRLKRTRKLKEKHNTNVAVSTIDSLGEGLEDLYVYSLGDVLQTPEDIKEWELTEWDSDTERKMDQESYEWIRLDADFEWACDFKRPLPAYMYVSQLQQDRDVVAQQDAILYLANGPLHPIAAGFLARTLYDNRYFHGIRSMAAAALTRQANIKNLPMRGLRQLMKAFREMYCYYKTNQPVPNNFTDKKQYQVRCSIIKAIAAVRNDDHRCPLEAQRLIIDQLRLNNNEDNPFSDHLYIALLVEELGKSMVPSKKDDWLARKNRVPSVEETQFLEEALEQVERVLRRDEWTNSYQNCWTIAGLDAKQRLMKAEVIPKRLDEFLQYLLDGTRDLIRIKAFAALVDLGAIAEPTLFSFLMYAVMTDRSPYVRKHYIEAVARGLAAIAFGELEDDSKNDAPAEAADGLLIVQDSNTEIETRKEKFARRENLDSALDALKREMTSTLSANKEQMSKAMLKAMDHPDLSRGDVDGLLDIASMMFDEGDTWILSLKYPKMWKVQRATMFAHNRLMMNFRSYIKTKPRVPLSSVSDVKRPITLQRSSSIKINTNRTPATPVASTPLRTALPMSASTEPAPSALPVSASAPALAVPATNGNSLGVDAHAYTNGNGSSAATTPSAPKRPLDDPSTPQVPKRPKKDSEPADSPAPERRVVTLKTPNKTRLAQILGQSDTSASPPPPVRKALPMGMPDEGTPKPVRKPLPMGPGAGAVSTPASKPRTLLVNTAPVPTASRPEPAPLSTPAPAPAPASALSATPSAGTPLTPVSARPKIKIIRKPQPPPSA